MSAKKKCACGNPQFWNSIMYIYEKKTTNINVSKVVWLRILITIQINFFGNMQKDLHATTLPNMCLFVTLDKNCSNLILKILETIAGQPRTFKCISSSNLCISDQHGLHVKVTNKSRKLTLPQITIPSKYNCSIYLRPPTNVEGNTTFFLFFEPWL